MNTAFWVVAYHGDYGTRFARANADYKTGYEFNSTDPTIFANREQADSLRDKMNSLHHRFEYHTLPAPECYIPA